MTQNGQDDHANFGWGNRRLSQSSTHSSCLQGSLMWPLTPVSSQAHSHLHITHTIHTPHTTHTPYTQPHTTHNHVSHTHHTHKQHTTTHYNHTVSSAYHTPYTYHTHTHTQLPWLKRTGNVDKAQWDKCATHRVGSTDSSTLSALWKENRHAVCAGHRMAQHPVLLVEPTFVFLL